MVVSGVIALTLSPVMSSFLLNSKVSEGRMAHLAEGFFGRLGDAYGRMLDVSLHHRWVTGLVAVVVLTSLPFLYNAAQRELAPIEDQSTVLTAVKSPQQANIDYVEKFGKKWDDVMATLPEQRGRWLINGSDGVSTASAASICAMGPAPPLGQRHPGRHAVHGQPGRGQQYSPSSRRRCRARPAACRCRWW